MRKIGAETCRGPGLSCFADWSGLYGLFHVEMQGLAGRKRHDRWPQRQVQGLPSAPLRTRRRPVAAWPRLGRDYRPDGISQIDIDSRPRFQPQKQRFAVLEFYGELIDGMMQPAIGERVDDVARYRQSKRARSCTVGIHGKIALAGVERVVAVVVKVNAGEPGQPGRTPAAAAK